MSSEIDELEVGYLMPCPNRPGVVDAIREFAAGMRPAISGHVITTSKNELAPYVIKITERARPVRRKKGWQGPPKPEEALIGFATNRQDVDISRYGDRWVIETGYRMVGNNRVKTRSKSNAVRALCFLFSLLLFNIWVMANAALTRSLRLRGVYAGFTQADVKLILGECARMWSGAHSGKPPPGRPSADGMGEQWGGSGTVLPRLQQGRVRPHGE